VSFSRNVLEIANLEAAADEIAGIVRRQVTQDLRRKGLVVGISGGIDSALCTALAVRAFGKDKVFGIFMPEKESSSESGDFGRLLADKFGIATATEDLAPGLRANGCYAHQDEAIRMVFPEYTSDWKFKIVIPSILGDARLNVSRVTVQRPDGSVETRSLTLDAYLQLVAATNFKQRTRTMFEYYHADRLNYAVCGTPNRLEYDQGFFVKGGDGLADVKPIAHLYKVQVYAMARALGVPEEICSRSPTTDTFSLPQGQDEFYYALPYADMDLCLYAHNHKVAAEEVAPVLGITAAQVERVYKDIDAKRRGTRPLHLAPLLAVPVPEIQK
jgi:NAD+ synthase